MAATAERAWSGLDPAARTAARLLLLRLVRLGEDTQATRRRGTRRQLSEESTEPGKTEESLEALVRARLVTLDAETVEITHEALLHAWPRLRDWIDEGRNDHLLRQRLEEDGRAWEGSNRDPSLLYRGSRLEQAHTWAKSTGDTLPDPQRGGVPGRLGPAAQAYRLDQPGRGGGAGRAGDGGRRRGGGRVAAARRRGVRAGGRRGRPRPVHAIRRCPPSSPWSPTACGPTTRARTTG